jgi:chromosome segregation ATPase
VIEQGLYFSLGFLVAAMMAIAILPAFWRRAYRLTRREIEETLPLSPKEIAAERDQLRAKFAVERRQLEQQMDAIKFSKQQDMSATGDKTMEIAQLSQELSSRNKDISSLRTSCTALEISLAATRETLATTVATLSSATDDLNTLSHRHGELEIVKGELQNLGEERRVEITALKTNLDAQRSRIDELDIALKGARAETKTRSDELRAVERTLRESEKDRAILNSKLESAEDISERRSVIIAERDSSIDMLKQSTSQLLKVSKDLKATLKEESRKAASIESQLQERDTTIVKLREDARQTATDLSKSIEKLRLEKQKMQIDLTELRTKSSQVQRELSSLKRTSSVSDLRQRAAVMDATK